MQVHNLVTHFVATRTRKERCKHCGRKRAVLKIECPNCGLGSLCSDCTYNHFLTLHSERDSLRELFESTRVVLDQTVTVITKKDEVLNQTAEEAQRLKAQNAMTAQLAKNVLLRVNGIVGQLVEAASKVASENGHLPDREINPDGVHR